MPFAEWCPGEQERRGALHVVGDHGGGHAAGFVEQTHAPVVAGDQRAFGGRQRHVELALSVLAVHQQGPGEPDRYLRDPDEVFGVPAQHRRVEGVPGGVLEAVSVCSHTNRCRTPAAASV